MHWVGCARRLGTSWKDCSNGNVIARHRRSPHLAPGQDSRYVCTCIVNELYQRSSCISHPADGFLVCISKRRHRPRRRRNISTTPCLKELAAWRHTVLPRLLKPEQALLSPVRKFELSGRLLGGLPTPPLGSFVLRRCHVTATRMTSVFGQFTSGPSQTRSARGSNRCPRGALLLGS